jgi:hypothetical protein
MTVQPVKDDSYTHPVERIPRAAVLGIRGSRISSSHDKRLSQQDCILPSHAHPDYTPKRALRDTTSYTDEHIRMKPVMDAVRKTRMFEPISAGFRLYCTKKTQPSQAAVQRKFFRLRSLVVTITWKWNHSAEKIIGLEARLNHESDLPWVHKKIESIFRKAGMKMPPLTVCHA